MLHTYHIRIKKEYAAAVIEDLQKMDAVELLTEDDITIPEWQKEAVRKTLADVKANPQQLQPWDVVKQKYKRP